jgi:hypothetical protein
MLREDEAELGADLPPVGDDLGGEPGLQLVRFGQRAPDDRRGIGQVALEADRGPGTVVVQGRGSGEVLMLLPFMSLPFMVSISL